MIVVLSSRNQINAIKNSSPIVIFLDNLTYVALLILSSNLFDYVGLDNAIESQVMSTKYVWLRKNKKKQMTDMIIFKSIYLRVIF